MQNFSYILPVAGIHNMENVAFLGIIQHGKFVEPWPWVSCYILLFESYWNAGSDEVSHAEVLWRWTSGLRKLSCDLGTSSNIGLYFFKRYIYIYIF